jgi:hypothetical protein
MRSLLEVFQVDACGEVAPYLPSSIFHISKYWISKTFDIGQAILNQKFSLEIHFY